MIQTGSTASNRHRYIGAISALRFPLKFTGTNVFHSNNGGGLNINHARIIINGRMEFIDNHGAALGGTIRLGELVLVSVLYCSYIKTHGSELCSQEVKSTLQINKCEPLL